MAFSHINLDAPGTPPGRNDPCPCGSGKKTKRCCGADRSPFLPLRGRHRGVVPVDLAARVDEMAGRLQRAGTRLLEIPMIGPKAVADIAQALRDRSVRSTDPIEVLALPPARAISERDSELVRMRQQGAGVAVIARRFGISRVRVQQILDRDGW